MFIFLALLILSASVPTEAAHTMGRGGYSSSLNRKIKALDEDKVKTFEIPVLLGVTLSNITPNFGDVRGGGTRTHEGLDIMAPIGTPVVTPTEAVVLNVGDGPSSGKFVSTANPGGERFVYMHLDTTAEIKSGDVLKVGDVIGTVGDTGNAKGGASHLHFEVRDDDATDPYLRIKKEYDLREKMEFLNRGFKKLDDEKDLAEFLVTRYTKEFQIAVNSGYELPSLISSELKDKGIISTESLQKQLDTIINSIPRFVTKQLALESQGGEVSLIQFYLISKNSGPAAIKLLGSGATGYYGPATAAAVSEYQTKAKIPVTGIYDVETRTAMLK